MNDPAVITVQLKNITKSSHYTYYSNMHTSNHKNTVKNIKIISILFFENPPPC